MQCSERGNFIFFVFEKNNFQEFGKQEEDATIDYDDQAAQLLENIQHHREEQYSRSRRSLDSSGKSMQKLNKVNK